MAPRLTVEDILKGKKPPKSKVKEAPPAPSRASEKDLGEVKKKLTKEELKKLKPLSITEKDQLRKLCADFGELSERGSKIFSSIGDDRMRAFMSEYGPIAMFFTLAVSSGARKVLGIEPGKTKDAAITSLAMFMPAMEVVEESDVPPLFPPSVSLRNVLTFLRLCFSSIRKVHGPMSGGPLALLQVVLSGEILLIEKLRADLAEKIQKELGKKDSGLSKAIKDQIAPIFMEMPDLLEES